MAKAKCPLCNSALTEYRNRQTKETGTCCGNEDCRLFAHPVEKHPARPLEEGKAEPSGPAVRWEHLAHDDVMWASDEVEYEPGKWGMLGAKWAGERWKTGMNLVRRKVAPQAAPAAPRPKGEGSPLSFSDTKKPEENLMPVAPSEEAGELDQELRRVIDLCTSEGLIPADEDGPNRIGYMVGKDDGKSPLYVTEQEAFAKAFPVLWSRLRSLPQGSAETPRAEAVKARLSEFEAGVIAYQVVSVPGNKPEKRREVAAIVERLRQAVIDAAHPETPLEKGGSLKPLLEDAEQAFEALKRADEGNEIEASDKLDEALEKLFPALRATLDGSQPERASSGAEADFQAVMDFITPAGHHVADYLAKKEAATKAAGRLYALARATPGASSGGPDLGTEFEPTDPEAWSRCKHCGEFDSAHRLLCRTRPVAASRPVSQEGAT